MLPGDHLDKMSTATIKVLNRKFKDVLDLFQSSVDYSIPVNLQASEAPEAHEAPEVSAAIEHITEASEVHDASNALEVSEVHDASEAPDYEIDILRFGTKYGEWYIPDIFDSNSVCFCVGAGEDITFDILLQRHYDSKVHIFDPTPRAIDHFYLVERVLTGSRSLVSNTQFGGGDVEYWNILQSGSSNFKRIFYYDYGISEQNNVERRFFFPSNLEHVSCSIENIQKTTSAFSALTLTINGAMEDTQTTKIDLLKLSVQGSEGKIILNMLDDGIFPTVICVQWDGALQGFDSKDSLYYYINQLENAGYDLIYDNQRLKHTFMLNRTP
jgi:hypothetical protein